MRIRARIPPLMRRMRIRKGWDMASTRCYKSYSLLSQKRERANYAK